MVYFFIKFKYVLMVYIHVLLFYGRYIHNIKSYVALNVASNYLKLLLNLFVIIAINMYIFIALLNLCEFYKLNEAIKGYILMLFSLNYAALKLVFKLVKVSVFNYFFNRFFYYLNKLKIFNAILKYLIIKEIMYVLSQFLYTNREYYMFYFTCLYNEATFMFYCKLKGRLREYDVEAYVIVSRIISKFLSVRKKILIVYRSIKIYKIVYNFYLKVIKVIKAVLYYFAFILNKFKNKIELFIILKCRFVLSIFAKSSIFYLLFFFFSNIIEHLAYLIKKL